MRDIVLFVLVCGLVPLILLRPWTGILAWFWVGLMAPHGLTWGFMRHFPIASLIGAATLVALVLARDKRTLPMKREMVMMFVLVGYVTMTSAFAINSDGAWAQWQQLMKILLMTFLTPILIYGDRRIIGLLLVVTFSIAFYGLKGGIFAITTGGGAMVKGPLGSFIEGNTYIGLAMVMVLPLVLASARMFHGQWIEPGWAFLKRHMRIVGLGFYGVFWLTVLAILATYSRGALLGLLAVAPFIFWRMKRKGVMIGLAVLGVAVAGVSAPERLVDRWSTIKTYEEDESAMQRIQSWGANWNIARENPILGKGFRNVEMGYAWYISYANFEGRWRHALSPHSLYFQLLGQHGFGGLVVFLLLIGFTLLTLGRIRKTAVQRSGKRWLAEYAWAIQVGLVGYMVAGAFLDVAYFNLVYAFVALAIIMRRELDEAPALARPAEKGLGSMGAGVGGVGGMGGYGGRA